MRVITGSARGIHLFSLPGDDVRPTAQRVKEAAFSAIQFYLAGAHVLDLFAGSGQLGIEALSRGAVSAVFVDGSDECLAVIRKNLQRTGLAERAKVVKNDSFRYLSRIRQPVDILFIDPPYRLGLAKKAVRRAEEWVTAGGFAVCETEEDAAMPEQTGALTLLKRYQYGRTAVWLYRNGERNDEDHDLSGQL